MAGFNQIIIVGMPGGFQGTDGVNRIDLLMLIGNSGRQWIELLENRFSNNPISNVKRIVPSAPDQKNSILDAIVLFCPELFSENILYTDFVNQLNDIEFIDFEADKNVPKDWETYRSSFIPIVKELDIYCGNFERVNFDD